MPQLNPEYFVSQVFWLFVVFCAIYFFVSRFFIPKISSIVNIRTQVIEDDVSFAESKVSECKTLETNASKTLVDARVKAFSIIEAATNTAEKDIASKLNALEIEISKKAAKEEEKLSRIRHQIQPKIEEIAQDLKKDIVSHIVKNLDKKKAKNN